MGSGYVNIATWNLDGPRMSGARARRLCAHIATIAADVWVFTETHPEVDPGSGFRLVASAAPAPDRAGDERWVTIWARTHLDAAPRDCRDAERAACVRLTESAGTIWYVYGTVLPWLGDPRRAPARGAAGFLAALQAQAADWSAIRAADAAARLCVAGDFNQDLLTVGHYYGSRQRREALRAALDQVGLQCPTAGVADPVVRIAPGHASVDHVCVSQGSPVATSVTTWPVDAELARTLSDHRGVMATIADA